MLEQAHDEDGSPMTAQELRDELITLLLDGPTSTSLAWAFERLLRHPEKLARLREEVRRGGEDDVYIDAVVKETLRLCPPVPIVVRRPARADAARRLHRPGRRDGRAVHLSGAPPRGPLPPPAQLHARALPRAARGDVHVDPVRRRCASLPGGELRAAGDEAGDRRRCSKRWSWRRCSRARSGSTRSSIAFAPAPARDSSRDRRAGAAHGATTADAHRLRRERGRGRMSAVLGGSVPERRLGGADADRRDRSAGRRRRREGGGDRDEGPRRSTRSAWGRSR